MADGLKNPLNEVTYFDLSERHRLEIESLNPAPERFSLASRLEHAIRLHIKAISTHSHETEYDSDHHESIEENFQNERKSLKLIQKLSNDLFREIIKYDKVMDELDRSCGLHIGRNILIVNTFGPFLPPTAYFEHREKYGFPEWDQEKEAAIDAMREQQSNLELETTIKAIASLAMACNNHFIEDVFIKSGRNPEWDNLIFDIQYIIREAFFDNGAVCQSLNEKPAAPNSLICRLFAISVESLREAGLTDYAGTNIAKTVRDAINRRRKRVEQGSPIDEQHMAHYELNCDPETCPFCSQ